MGGRRYEFRQWSDAGAGTHTISTPLADTTYTASFTDVGAAVDRPPSVTMTAADTGRVGTPMSLVASASDDGAVQRVEFFDGTCGSGRTPRRLMPSTGRPPPPERTASRRAPSTTPDSPPPAPPRSSRSALPRPPTASRPASRSRHPPISPTSLGGTLPLNNGVLALAATASDNVGVTQVEFQLDGASVGPPDTQRALPGQRRHDGLCVGAAHRARPRPRCRRQCLDLGDGDRALRRHRDLPQGFHEERKLDLGPVERHGLRAGPRRAPLRLRARRKRARGEERRTAADSLSRSCPSNGGASEACTA